MPTATRRRENFVGFYADDPALIAQLDVLAKRNDRSRSAEIRMALAYYLKREALLNAAAQARILGSLGIEARGETGP
jgi:hypothetical protein